MTWRQVAEEPLKEFPRLGEDDKRWEELGPATQDKLRRIIAIDAIEPDTIANGDIRKEWLIGSLLVRAAHSATHPLPERFDF